MGMPAVLKLVIVGLSPASAPAYPSRGFSLSAPGSLTKGQGALLDVALTQGHDAWRARIPRSGGSA
jgi:hypothetical protein